MTDYDVYPLNAEPDLEAHLGFILAEEDALKKHLTDITVPTRPGTTAKTKVGVWFRYPEGERQIEYPFITIDFLNAEPAFDLFHSEHWYMDPENLYRPSFSPTLPPPPGGWATQSYRVRNFLPFRLTWQVSHFARNALHDRYLTSIFKTDVFPVRPFFIECQADDTWRRTEVVNFVSADSPETTESGTKRIFRKIYTIAMLAGVPQERLADEVVYNALRVYIPVVAREQFDTYRHTFMDNQSDPINDFSEEDRQKGGEYFHVWHEGQNTPSPP